MLITDGRLIDPSIGLDEVTDIALECALVRALGSEARRVGGKEVIEAGGLCVSPGFVDSHVHFRDPGYTYKEDIFTGSAAAAAGGFTSVVCMANTNPVLDTPSRARGFLARVEGLPIRVYTVAALSRRLAGKRLTDFAALSEAGAAAFSDDGRPVLAPSLLKAGFRAAASCGKPVLLHEEDPALIGTAGINEGTVSRKLGLRGASGESETSLVERDCVLARETGAHVHFQHLSASASVEAVEQAREAGANVSAEVTPSHLCFTEEAVLTRGALAKVNPPLRSERDRLSLIKGLQNGVITVIATDHAPHADFEKQKPFTQAPSGIIGLETALAACITHLVRKGLLTLPALVASLTSSPARLFGLKAGSLAPGAPADLTLFDPDEAWEVRDFRSKSRNSLFLGETLYGRVKLTICRGRVVYKG